VADQTGKMLRDTGTAYGSVHWPLGVLEDPWRSC
jgi:hypothetical protein